MKNQLLFISMVSLLTMVSCHDEPPFTVEKSNFALENSTMFLKNRGGGTIKIATYNLHLFLGPALFEDHKRQHEIEKFIKADLRKNDVLFLTEVWSDHAKNKMVEHLKDIYPYSMHSNAEHINQGDGLLLLSKFPIQESKFVTFHDGAGWDWFVPKGFHKTRITTPYGDFYSFFTHTQADDYNRRTRKKQFEQMKIHMNDLNGVPSIIVGDLNMVGECFEYNMIMNSVFSNYKDSYREANVFLNQNSGFTYDNTTNSLANHFYSVAANGKSQERLDYILYSDDWTAIGSNVMNRCNYRSPAFGTTVSCSDHYGLESELMLTKKITQNDLYITDNKHDAYKMIDHLKAAYGIGLTAKIIIHNKTNKNLAFKNKSSWYNSSFFNSPPANIPPNKYGVILATHDTGQATGVFNQFSYQYENILLSFGSYVPWSWVYTNNVLVSFDEINQYQLNHYSTKPSIRKTKNNIRITGEIATGDSPYVVFTAENL